MLLELSTDGVDSIPLLADTFLADGSLYLKLYETAALPAAAVVMTYMTLREVGKAGGPKQAAGNTVSSAVGAIKGAFDKITGKG